VVSFALLTPEQRNLPCEAKEDALSCVKVLQLSTSMSLLRLRSICTQYIGQQLLDLTVRVVVHELTDRTAITI